MERDGAFELLDLAKDSTVRDVLEWKESRKEGQAHEKKEVIVIDVHTTVGRALRKLSEGNVLSAPVVVVDHRDVQSAGDGNGDVVTLVGFLGVADVLKVFLDAFVRDAFTNNRELIAEDSDAVARAEELDRLGELLESKTVSSVCNSVHAGAFSSPQRFDGGVIYDKDVDMSLLFAIQEGFFNAKDLFPAHRLLILEPRNSLLHQKLSSPTTTMFARGKIVDILSQSDVVGFLAHKLDALPSLSRCRINELKLSTSWSEMVFVTSDMPALDVLSMMSSKGLSSIAVIAHDSVESPRAVERGKLEANLSPSDFRGLGPHEFRQLVLPVWQFLSLRDEVSGSGMTKKPRLVTIREDATFRDLLVQLSVHRVHRVYITGDGNRAMGVISLTDILRLFGNFMSWHGWPIK